MSAQMHEILYTESQDMLVLSSTVALHCYNCCTDGSTSPHMCEDSRCGNVNCHDGLCCVGFINLIGGVAGVRRQETISIGST
jgi:hypothetical protein